MDPKGKEAQRRKETIGQMQEHTLWVEERTETLRLARILALAGLPRKRTKEREIYRDIRLGTSAWVRVRYTALNSKISLPFGSDRLLLSVIQDLAIKQKSSVINIGKIRDILDKYEIVPDGRRYQTVKSGLMRLSKFVISFGYGQTKEELELGLNGENTFLIKKYKLPKKISKNYVENISLINDDENLHGYGIEINSDFLNHLSDKTNWTVIPLDLLRLFRNRPYGFDYCNFLITRCFRAKKQSIVDHYDLLSLFRDSEKEPERDVFKRLVQYHQEIRSATCNLIRADLDIVGKIQGLRGRRAAKWALRIHPMSPEAKAQLVKNGRKTDQL